MTGGQEDFEARLRRVLAAKAGQLQVAPAHWRGPSPVTRRRRVPRPDSGGILALAGVLVAAVIAVFAVALLGHRHSGMSGRTTSNPLPPPPAAALYPHMSRSDLNQVGAAARTVFAHDRACRGFHGPETTTGSPSRSLVSMFGILRHPSGSAGDLGQLLHWSPGAQLYVNQVHRARSAYKASFYVLPAGNVSGQRGVPARCGPEEVAALERQLSTAPRRRRARILAGQRRYLAYLRYLAVHAEGLCAGFRTTNQAGGDGLACATVADFERWGVLVDASVYLDHAAVFWTVVPDGVASVTLRFVAGGPCITPSRRP
jgi:hypothetical protein